MRIDPAAEADLLTRLRSGDAEVRRGAERDLVARFDAPLERMMRRLLGRDTEDCTQEALLDVFRGLPAFEGRSSLSTWVYRIALRRAWKCLATSRRAADRREASELDEVPAPSVAAGVELESAELAARFERALERLDVDQRTVLALTAIEGLGPSEIAEVLGVPTGTVHSRLHRARALVSEWLGLG